MHVYMPHCTYIISCKYPKYVSLCVWMRTCMFTPTSIRFHARARVCVCVCMCLRLFFVAYGAQRTLKVTFRKQNIL